MALFSKKPIFRTNRKKEIPGGLWTKCPGCGELHDRSEGLDPSLAGGAEKPRTERTRQLAQSAAQDARTSPQTVTQTINQTIGTILILSPIFGYISVIIYLNQNSKKISLFNVLCICICMVSASLMIEYFRTWCN